MEWNNEQLDAVRSRGQNLLVSAAAGSGKTAVLTERVRRIKADGTDLDRMLIITFTNAAAAEMRERILKDDSASVLEKYYISTFSKFAIEVYKSYYHVAGLPPGLVICDEYKQQILRAESLDEMFEELFENGDEVFLELLNRYCSPKSNDILKDMVGSLYDFIQSMPDPAAWMAEIKQKAFDPKLLFRLAADTAQEGVEQALELFFKTDAMLSGKNAGILAMPKLAEKNMADIAKLEGILEMLKTGREEAGLAALGSISYERLVPVKAEKPDYDANKDIVIKPREQGKDVIKDLKKKLGHVSPDSLEKERELLQPSLAGLCSLTEDFAALYARKKLSAGLMDFSDAEHFALRILEDPEVCRELKEKFEYIFVDEYQDSNYVQEEMIRRISRGNNVFLVGDVKQSIYKFRLAEPEIFLEKYHRFRTGDDPLSRVIDLNKNYRSKQVGIDLINKVFRRVMNMRTVGLDYDDKAALDAGSDYSGSCIYQPRLYVISMDRPEDEETVDDTIEEMKAEELEALNTARLIKEWLGKPIEFKGKERPLRYKDMAVLLRAAKSRGEVFYQTLSGQGIPVYLERGEGYFDTPEIQVLLNLLRVTDDPRQDVALLSVMHFPSVGFSASELARIRIEDKEAASYYDALISFAGQDVKDDLHAKAVGLLGQLARWRRKASALPLSDLVWQLMHESGIAAFAQALPGGQQRMANLRAMADRAESYENETAGGIGGFISYIEMITVSGKGKVDTGQVKLLTESDDVVRIMTIHKSKGLEFPLVILAGLGVKLGGRPDPVPMRMHRQLGVSMKLADAGRGLKAVPDSYRIIDDKLGNESFAEDIRVLYVAMTRARDILLMSAAVKKAEDRLRNGSPSFCSKSTVKNYLDMLLPSFPKSMVELLPYEQAMSAGDAKDPGADIRLGIEYGFTINEAELPLSFKELKARLDHSFEPSAESMQKRKFSVSEITELRRNGRLGRSDAQAETVSAAEVLPRSVPRDPKLLTGAQKGTAYHAVMENIPFVPEGKDEDSIAQFIESLRIRRMLSDAEAAAVDPARIAAFFRSELGKRAMAAEELHKEAPFMMKTELDGHDVLVQGVIDCYFMENGSLVLVDYKSNYVDRSDPEGSAKHLRENYLPQLELYKEALEGICGIKVSESYLYFFGLDDSIKL